MTASRICTPDFSDSGMRCLLLRYKSTNLTVATVGPPLENLKQVDHCRYTKIELMDPEAVPYLTKESTLKEQEF
ncbi:hypothetical protein CS542_01800 [Pedobacter sp. IW39]|nr:hypothetical protein CS542_01800 [Pedobacter sp. IW39]